MQHPEYIPGIYEACYRAHQGTSFSPEVRARNLQKEFESVLSEKLSTLPIEYHQEFREKFTQKVFAWMNAKSRCMSSMITGPANFPVSRNEAANRTEQKRGEEFYSFLEWFEKKVKNNRPIEDKRAEEWGFIQKGLMSSLQTILDIDNGTNRYSSRSLIVSNVCGRIKTLARNDREFYLKAIDFIKSAQSGLKKPLISDKNSIWNLLPPLEDTETQKKDEVIDFGSSQVILNHAEDRVQIKTDGVPNYDTRSKMKSAGFKWAPSKGVWQNYLNHRNISFAKELINQLNKP